MPESPPWRHSGRVEPVLEPPTPGIRVDAIDKAHLRQLSEAGAVEKKVSHSLCQWIRTARHYGETIVEIAGAMEDISFQAVHYHTSGECDHDVAVPPIHSRSPVTWVRCVAFRHARERGQTSQQIADSTPFDISPSSVRHHCRGDCSHDNGRGDSDG